jgi:predicted transglutaminase-like cysteine proteinase
VQFCRDNAERCAAAGNARRVVLDAQKLRQLASVNKAVNRAIKGLPGSPPFNWWRNNVAQGWCGDYAVTKLTRLLDLGWSGGAVRPAQVVVPSGVWHTVLIISTTDTDLVLDSLNDEVVRVDAPPYHWLSVASEEDPLRWRYILPPNSRPR